MDVRVLSPADASEYHRLRLEGLRESPTSFAAHFEEERGSDAQAVAVRVPQDLMHMALVLPAGKGTPK
jgi:hypothetical protein